MPYIGKQLVRGQNRKLDDISSGFNGSQTTFTLQVASQNVTVGSALQLWISLGGVIQDPLSDYTIAGNQITFTTAPAASLDFFGVIQGDVTDTNTPGDATVTTSKLATGLTVNLANGSAATSSLQLGGTDSGLFSGAADQVGFTTGGAERLKLGNGEAVFNDISADTDFRVESNGRTHMIFVDAGNDAVGIGTAVPRSYGSSVTLATDNPSADNTFTIAAGTSNNASIHFADGLSGDDANRGIIKYEHNNNAMAFSTNALERLRIDSSGNVGIGTASPGRTLDVNGVIRSDGTSGGLAFGGNSSTPSEGAAIHRPANNTLAFVTNSSERMRIDSAGMVKIGTGSTVTPDANADDFVIDKGAADTGLSILSTTTGRIYFGDAADDEAGSIRYVHSDDSMRLETASSERMRIDSTGKVLVGASSARTSWNNQTIGAGILQVERSGNAFATAITVTANSGTTNRTSAVSAAARLLLGRSTGTSVGSNTIVANGDILGDVSFQGNDGAGFVEAAAIQAFCDATPGSDDMPGRLVFKTTADGASSADEKMRIFHTGQTHHFSTVNGLFVGSSQGAGATNWLFRGNRNRTSNSAGGVTVFYVYTNGNVQNTNNSYGAISDSKLKENIVDATSQWDDLKALQVRKYNFIEGETHTQIGVIAQEVETVSPGLVNDIADRDEEGNDLGTVTKTVNYSVLYMKAVKALQEAMERIETLEAKVAALEAE